jgi:predicted Ser/Thr protein kinase
MAQAGACVSDRWRRVGQLFDRAVAAAPDQRNAILDASGEPRDLIDEVRSLLAAHDAAGTFLEAPESLRADPPLWAASDQVGPYRIAGILGRGGMGVVYDAEDTRLHRRVALKALPPEVSGDERQQQRLRQEARAAAALQHPGIATIYALEEIDGHLFISSEYLDGETLRQALDRERLTPSQTLAAAVEISQALCTAHERGIVHRDLKPENIIRTREGALKILDFGLAQFDPATEIASRSRLTMTGMLAGTPAYMAPEQLLGGATDFHVDHFAFGVMLYELCTGRHPFAANSLPSTVARILAAPPDPPPRDALIPSALWQVIDRCLQKDPSHRYASTRELLDALRSATIAHGSDAVASDQPAHDHPAPAVALPAPLPAPPALPALRWWRFHQFAAAAVYWAMVWPVWHVHRAFGRVGLFVFFATLATVVVAANLRLHLWFSSRVYPEDLPQQRADVTPWIRWADIGFAALLVIGGIALPDTHAGWAALLISVGIGAAVAFVFIEPATSRAAWRAEELRTKGNNILDRVRQFR